MLQIPSIPQFLLESSLILCLGYALYYFQYKQSTLFQFNRFYLIAICVLAYLIPAINIDWQYQEQSTLNHNLLLENVITQTNQYESQFQSRIEAPISTTLAYTWSDIILAVFYLGVFLLSCRLLLGIGKLIWFIYKAKDKKSSGAYRFLPSTHLPIASFFNYIFYSNQELNEEEKIMLEHEKVHVRQWHSLDILIIEIITIFNWFNPIIYLYKNRLKETHEYIADQYVTNNLTNPYTYAQLLVSESQKTQRDTNPFITYFHSLTKKRLIMLSNTSSRYSKLKILWFIPLITITLLLFSFDLSEQTALSKLNESVENIAETLDQNTLETPKSSKQPLTNSLGFNKDLIWNGLTFKLRKGKQKDENLFYHSEIKYLEAIDFDKISKEGAIIFEGKQQHIKSIRLNDGNFLPFEKNVALLLKRAKEVGSFKLDLLTAEGYWFGLKYRYKGKEPIEKIFIKVNGESYEMLEGSRSNSFSITDSNIKDLNIELFNQFGEFPKIAHADIYYQELHSTHDVTLEKTANKRQIIYTNVEQRILKALQNPYFHRVHVYINGYAFTFHMENVKARPLSCDESIPDAECYALSINDKEYTPSSLMSKAELMALSTSDYLNLKVGFVKIPLENYRVKHRPLNGVPTEMTFNEKTSITDKKAFYEHAESGSVFYFDQFRYEHVYLKIEVLDDQQNTYEFNGFKTMGGIISLEQYRDMMKGPFYYYENGQRMEIDELEASIRIPRTDPSSLILRRKGITESQQMDLDNMVENGYLYIYQITINGKKNYPNLAFKIRDLDQIYWLYDNRGRTDFGGSRNISVTDFKAILQHPIQFAKGEEKEKTTVESFQITKMRLGEDPISQSFAKNFKYDDINFLKNIAVGDVYYFEFKIGMMPYTVIYNIGFTPTMFSHHYSTSKVLFDKIINFSTTENLITELIDMPNPKIEYSIYKNGKNGEKIFQTNNPHLNWDGTDAEGNKVESGTYFITYEVFYTGDLTNIKNKEEKQYLQQGNVRGHFLKVIAK